MEETATAAATGTAETRDKHKEKKLSQGELNFRMCRKCWVFFKLYALFSDKENAACVEKRGKKFPLGFFFCVCLSGAGDGDRGGRRETPVHPESIYN